MGNDIFKPATPEDIKIRNEEYMKKRPDELCRDIGECKEDLLTRKNLDGSLFYPASELDFKVVETFNEINVFIYADASLGNFLNFYCGRRESNELEIVSRKLVTLEQILQIDDIPETSMIDSRIEEVFGGYLFADGRFRTEPGRTPVGLFDIKAKLGTKRLFYIVNEGYWTYLHLFKMGDFAPKILYMSPNMVADISGIPAFESDDGIKKLFKAKPGMIVEG
jgi:hypothetical protein